MTEQTYYNPQQAPQPPKKGLPTWVWITVSVVVVLGLLIGLTVAAVNKAAHSLSDLGSRVAQEAETYTEPYIAVLHIEGTMAQETPDLYTAGAYYDHDYLLESLAQLQEDDYNAGLLLYIDSPGGEVMAASQLGEAIAAYKQLTGRPVYAYGHNYAASGGYWVAAPADSFYCNRYCLTGSIGVTYGTMLDFSGFLAEHGVKTNTITSGAQKAMGSSFEEMTPETRAIFQSLIDEYYGYFLDWVSSQRGIDRAVLQPLADGRVYTASQAVSLGLADAVGDYDQCLAALTQACGGGELRVKSYSPSQEDDWTWLLRYLSYGVGERELSALEQVLPPTGILAYYEG